MSKCGRYGEEREDFDYTPTTIRRSLLRTLERLGTSYLDAFFLHDVEFVATPVHPPDPTGDPIVALQTDDGKEAWGHREGEESKVHGKGDEMILAGYGELLKLKEEGLVRTIGITGLSLECGSRLPVVV